MLQILFYWFRVCLLFYVFLAMSRKTFYDLSNMSEDDVSAFMEIISYDDDDTGDEDGMDFDSDDSVGDPDYVFSEDELLIDNELSATEITSAIEMNINVNNTSITEYELPFSGDQVESNSSISTEPVQSTSSTIPTNTAPYDSSRSTFTRSKRQREIELQEEEGGPTGSTCGIFNGVTSEIRNNSPEMKSIIWKQKNLQLHVNELVFRGQKDMPEEVKRLKTPKDCFLYFLTDDFIQVLFNQL